MAVEPSGSSPVSLKPTTCGISIDTGWPSIAASASMPPTPQPSTPRPLIIVVCESVPTSVSGNAWPSRDSTTRAEVLEVHLVADAGVRRHHLEVVEGRLAPAQERVALLVALELELGVALEREPLGEHVHLDRVVDDEFHRHQRVDLGGVAAEVLHGVAHRGEVDDRRHAGEVLHQHAGGPVGDLLRRLVASPPTWRRPRAPSSSPLRSRFSSRTFSAYGQARDVVLLLKRVQAKDLERLAADVERGTRAESVSRAHAATAVDMRERMLSGAPAAASGLSVAAELAPAAVSNARTVVSPELVISSRVCVRLPT